jgi:hypothetical protein
MSRQLEKMQSRREMFISALRYAALSVLGAVGGSVFAKKRNLIRNGICINREICRSCGIFEECGLPPALSEKANVKENKR